MRFTREVYEAFALAGLCARPGKHDPADVAKEAKAIGAAFGIGTHDDSLIEEARSERDEVYAELRVANKRIEDLESAIREQGGTVPPDARDEYPQDSGNASDLSDERADDDTTARDDGAP